MSKDVAKLSNVYNNIDEMKILDSKLVINQFNSGILSFIEGLTGRCFNMTHDKQVLFKIGVSLESIYYLKNSNLVLPHCFLTNIIETITSGSKTVTAVNGKVLPASGDTLVRYWLKEHGSEVLSTPTHGDLEVWYDNIGKYIVKSYRINSEHNLTPTVVTATQNILLTSNDFIQSMVEYSPNRWPGRDMPEEKIQQKMLELVQGGISDFREYRFTFLNSLFEYMYSSNEMEGLIASEITHLKEAHLTRQCSVCNRTYPARKQKCDGCGGKVVSVADENNALSSFSFESRLPKYIDVGQNCSKNVVEITTGEPIMVNPNSYESVEEVLKDIKNRSVVSSPERKWVQVGADGPPYCLMRRIVKAKPDEFGCISITSGKGHLKMNVLKTLFKVCDTVMFEVLGKDVLKFDTVKSYDYFINCKDNHKAFEALEVFLIGTTMELIRMYAGDVSEDPTVLGFLQWSNSVKTPTLSFVCQLVLNFAMSAYILRVGDRANDSRCSNAARMRFLDMFYAFNHPIYREVEYSELKERAISPEAVIRLKENNLTYVTKENAFELSHEDGDFRLEEIVRVMKRLSPKGKMSREMWLRVARGMDDVNAVVSHGKALLNLEQDGNRPRTTPLEKEIVLWRAHLRNSGYLKSSSSYISTMSGSALDPALVNFTEILAEKRNKYWELAQSTSLENIRYENITLTGDDEEILPYVFSEDEYY